MLGLTTGLFVLLIIAILCACIFEFINGFHDTANAVATVIYTNSLKPIPAVIISGIFNMLGVFIGGISVAMGIVALLPIEAIQTQTQSQTLWMVVSMMLSAIIWNFGTWYFGIPASSSHTLIGAILGTGLAISMLPGHEFGDGVNWSKAQDVGLSLLISPLFGFTVGSILLAIAKMLLKNPKLHTAHQPNEKPNIIIRILMTLTCIGISFFHGQNDGQKGVGLVMIILITALPAYYALDTTKDFTDLRPIIISMEKAATNIEEKTLNLRLKAEAQKLQANLTVFKAKCFECLAKDDELSAKDRIKVRGSIYQIDKGVKKVSRYPETIESFSKEINTLKQGSKQIRAYTDYVPNWVVVMISLCIGIGTMIGWKRVVVTVGEKIGKSGMTYAQGLVSGLVASSTIGLSSGIGLPVSTTHVLSSSVAGTMVAQGGRKNVQLDTIKKILLAWVLTLPVCMALSMILFFVFRLFA
ncbi:MAG: inorganic phosphate transporter [Bacteroidia bacterium]|nr:inorganic phosphate transporter [Bacteroidia bacterium]MDW8301730.1 inorganic phosphate transporter [Bacteroidia bacterium]